jgi:hypothetical protein
MNRLNFLKTLSFGVAAAVITPKVLIETSQKPVVSPPIKTREEAKDFDYAHYEEDMPRYTVESLRVHDMCVDIDLRMWMCTAIILDSIELTALSADPLPNFIEVKRSNFDEYFFITSINRIKF